MTNCDPSTHRRGLHHPPNCLHAHARPLPVIPRPSWEQCGLRTITFLDFPCLRRPKSPAWPSRASAIPQSPISSFHLTFPSSAPCRRFRGSSRFRERIVGLFFICTSVHLVSPRPAGVGRVSVVLVACATRHLLSNALDCLVNHSPSCPGNSSPFNLQSLTRWR